MIASITLLASDLDITFRDFTRDGLNIHGNFAIGASLATKGSSLMFRNAAQGTALSFTTHAGRKRNFAEIPNATKIPNAALSTI